MGLFTPAWYNEKKSADERQRALEKENNPKRLRQVALDGSLSNDLRAIALEKLDDPALLRQFALNGKLYEELREIAVKKLRDPELCERLLMEYANQDPGRGPCNGAQKHYIAAASILNKKGEQARLQRIYRSCTSVAMQAIVIDNIDDQAFLEAAAINANNAFGASYGYTDAAQCAVNRLVDQKALARVAAQAGNRWTQLAAVRKIGDEALLGEIALSGADIDARLEAVKQMRDPAAVAAPLREALLPEVLADPVGSPRAKAELLARCGDDLGALMLWCNGDEDHAPKRWYLPEVQAAALRADPEVLYPALKKLLETLLAKRSYSTMQLTERVGGLIKLLHDNGRLAERIEADWPQTVDYGYAFSGEVDGKTERGEGGGQVRLW